MTWRVASGKSTLCKALLGEVSYGTGVIEVNLPQGAISYCAHTPFLSGATLQENIIGHSGLDKRKYDAVISATLLDVDIATMQMAHKTRLGSNGILLSGGQKSRVALTRSLYHETELMIFDDVFGGLDANTEQIVFRRVFGPNGILRQSNTTVVLCTHSVRQLRSADYIIAFGDEGSVVDQGDFESLRDGCSYVSKLEIAESEDDENDAENDAEKNDFLNTAHTPSPETPPSVKGDLSTDDGKRQTADWSVHVHYAENISKWAVFSFLGIGLLYGAAQNFGTVWVSLWAKNTFHSDKRFYIGFYGLIRGIEIFSLIALGVIGLIVIVSSAGQNLHLRAINTVAAAPLSLFTDVDLGTVTNLFSQDMTLIDGELPMGLLNTHANLSALIGNLVVVAIASPYLAIGYPFLFAILYMFQIFYLRTSRQLRLLDLEAKSPL